MLYLAWAVEINQKTFNLHFAPHVARAPAASQHHVDDFGGSRSPPPGPHPWHRGGQSELPVLLQDRRLPPRRPMLPHPPSPGLLPDHPHQAHLPPPRAGGRAPGRRRGKGRRHRRPPQGRRRRQGHGGLPMLPRGVSFHYICTYVVRRFFLSSHKSLTIIIYLHT